MDFPNIRIIDAHMHQWDPFTTPRDFGPLAKLFRFLPLPIDMAMRLGPRRDIQFAGDPSAYLHPYLPSDYRADAADTPVAAVAHIEVEWAAKEPLAKADETAWVARLPFDDGGPELGAILGSADPAAPGFAAVLDAHLAASPLFCGIRTMVAHHHDPAVRSFTKTESVLTTGEFLDGFAHLAERELGFEAWVYSHALPDVSALARRYPEVPIVLNHLGTPAGIFGAVGKRTGTNPSLRREIFVRWRDDLAELASHANVVAKVSGLMMPILGHPVPRRGTATPVSVLLDRVAPLVEHALDAFGADRLLWGSNYPVDKPITSIANSVRTIAEAITGHGGGATELGQVFHGTAARVYRINSPS
ncbi:amidohydrolase family protein [Nocardia sp. NPDC052566]|uniref:amidohydrolase family protein n=1 Tax=Nocardia sp. NPDC052566 TaxID=3364330 RepID=UPI0037CADFBD